MTADTANIPVTNKRPKLTPATVRIAPQRKRQRLRQHSQIKAWQQAQQRPANKAHNPSPVETVDDCG